MVLADYPFLEVLWTMLIFFVWIAWFMLLIRIVADVFRRRDIGGGMKTLWLLFILFVPFLGVFVYLIAENNEMAERDMAQARKAQSEFDTYVQSVSGAGGSAGEIEKAKQLLDQGAIDQTEYETIKRKALAT